MKDSFSPEGRFNNRRSCKERDIVAVDGPEVWAGGFLLIDVAPGVNAFELCFSYSTFRKR